MVYLPPTLHGRLYLLSYDRERHRFDDQNLLFPFALRAAMLTDLYLTGHVTDEGGWAYVSDAARPDDPVLAAACDQIRGAALMDWDELITIGEWAARDEVRDQLRAAAARRWPARRPWADADGFEFQGMRAAPTEVARNDLCHHSSDSGTAQGDSDISR